MYNLLMHAGSSLDFRYPARIVYTHNICFVRDALVLYAIIRIRGRYKCTGVVIVFKKISIGRIRLTIRVDTVDFLRI